MQLLLTLGELQMVAPRSGKMPFSLAGRGSKRTTRNSYSTVG